MGWLVVGVDGMLSHSGLEMLARNCRKWRRSAPQSSKSASVSETMQPAIIDWPKPTGTTSPEVHSPDAEDAGSVSQRAGSGPRSTYVLINK